MHFPVSGVDVFPLVPPLVAMIVSLISTSAGITGAFLLLPFQVSVLHFNSPAVSPTNLIYNIIAAPGGLYRYIKEKRMAWALTGIISVGTLPGVFIGAWIRIHYLTDPKAFKLFVGIVLVYLSYRLLSDIFGWNKKTKEQNALLNIKFAEQVALKKDTNHRRLTAGLPAEAVVKTKYLSFLKVEFEFWGETYSFKTIPVFILALGVGLIGGIYGIGGGSIISPVCVSLFALPIYTVAGAALASTFITSIAGVIYYQILAVTTVSSSSVSPDWLLGLMLGLGGIFGTYFGAYLQKFLPETLIKKILLVLTSILSISYILQYFL